MNNIKKQKQLTIQNLIIYFICMYMVAPVISRIVSTYMSTYLYMALIVLFVVFALTKLEHQERDNLLAILLPFLVYELLTVFLNTNSLFLWGYRILLFLLPIILGCFILQKPSDEISGTAKLVFFTFAITLITTITGLIQYPGASRILATFSDSQDPDAILYSWHNIGGYEFVYMVVLLYPIVILAHKRGKINLLTTILISASILALAIYSEYTTALLLFIITSVLHFMKRDLKPGHIVFMAIVSIVAITFFNDFFVGLIEKLSDTVESETMSERLEALAGGQKGLEESEDNRLELYMMSINTFLKHFFMGTFVLGYSNMGGHSFILDSLANYGLLGGFFVFSMYRKIYSTFYLPYKDKMGYGYVLWVFIQAIVLSILNTGMWLEVLALFAPIFFYCIYKEEDSTDEDYVDSKFSVRAA